jgi:hypothetical protein
MQKKLYYILFISNTPVPVPTSVGATGFMVSQGDQVDSYYRLGVHE